MNLSATPYYDHATHWKCSSIPNLIIVQTTVKVNFKLTFPHQFNCLNMNIALNIVLELTKCSTSIENILLQGTASQNVFGGLSFDVMTNNSLS